MMVSGTPQHPKKLHSLWRIKHKETFPTPGTWISAPVWATPNIPIFSGAKLSKAKMIKFAFSECRLPSQECAGVPTLWFAQVTKHPLLIPTQDNLQKNWRRCFGFIPENPLLFHNRQSREIWALIYKPIFRTKCIFSLPIVTAAI